MHIESDAVHAGREDLEECGVHALPLDLSTTYPVRDLELGTMSFDALASGVSEAPNPIYARVHNPTVHRFEKALARLERAEEAVAFASGMAALSAVLLEARQRGRHVVAIRPLYGGSDHLLTSHMLDLDVTFASPSSVTESLRSDTSLVILETPANPTLDVLDIEDVVHQSGSVPVLVDSTFATPVRQNPLDHGARLVLHSATKAIGGHGDAVGGVVATERPFAAALRRIRILTGGILHPLAAYQLHRGLQTLPLRMDRAESNARVLAERLVSRAEVKHVSYPGLGDVPAFLARQMHGPGAVLALTLEGGYEAARHFLRVVRLVTPAVSLGCNDTLVQHPAGLTHRALDEETKRATRIDGGLLRLSVGIENVEDLWADLVHAISARIAPANGPRGGAFQESTAGRA